MVIIDFLIVLLIIMGIFIVITPRMMFMIILFILLTFISAAIRVSYDINIMRYVLETHNKPEIGEILINGRQK